MYVGPIICERREMYTIAHITFFEIACLSFSTFKVTLVYGKIRKKSVKIGKHQAPCSKRNRKLGSGSGLTLKSNITLKSAIT